jgi:aminoglycoside phosphotransferase (APT) family kinase protein
VRRHFRIAAVIDGAPQDFVLRTHGLTPLGIGLDLAPEFALLRHLAAAGIAVPPPVFYSDDAAIIGAPFHVTRFVAGTADPETIVASAPQPDLAHDLGHELALIQRVTPPPFLGDPPRDGIAARIERAQRALDALGEARPVAEWAMRWLARQRIAPLEPVLAHGDFRTGNYLAAKGRLSALLDWEFASWGDPDEDLGWFCSRCWRFGSAYEAGGIAAREALYRGYAEISGRSPDPARVRVWEAMAALKWLVIALHQRDRYSCKGEPSLDLALTGRRAAECEYELMRYARSA